MIYWLIDRDVAQLGSAAALGAVGRRFKSCRPEVLRLGSTQEAPKGLNMGEDEIVARGKISCFLVAAHFGFERVTYNICLLGRRRIINCLRSLSNPELSSFR